MCEGRGSCWLVIVCLLCWTTVVNCVCWLFGGGWTDVVAAAAADESFADVLLNFDFDLVQRCDARHMLPLPLPLPTLLVSNAENLLHACLPMFARMQELWWCGTDVCVCGECGGFGIRLVRELLSLKFIFPVDSCVGLVYTN